MPKFEVEVEVKKTYLKTYNITVYADSEDEAEEKAEERVGGWDFSGCDEHEIEINGVSEA